MDTYPKKKKVATCVSAIKAIWMTKVGRDTDTDTVT